MSHFCILWEHPEEFARPTTLAEAQAVVAFLLAGPAPSESYFSTLGEQLVNQLPLPEGPAPSAASEAPTESLQDALEHLPSPVLVLRLDGSMADRTPELVRMAVGLGLCVYDLGAASLFTPWGRVAGDGDAAVWQAWAAVRTPVPLHDDLHEFATRRRLDAAMAPLLEAAGFARRGRLTSFVRPFVGGEQEVRVTLTSGGWIDISLITRHDAVRDVLRRVFPARTADAWAQHTVPLHRFVMNLSNFMPDPAEAPQACEVLAELTHSLGVPLLACWENLQLLDAMINSGPYLRIPPAMPDSAPLCLTVARLAGSQRFNQLVHEYLRPAGHPYAAPRADLVPLIEELKRLVPRWQHGVRLYDDAEARAYPAGLREDCEAALAIYRTSLLEAHDGHESAQSYAAVADDRQSLLRKLLPVAEARGFRVVSPGRLVRPIPGGEQTLWISISFSNSASILAYVFFSTTFHAVNRLYSRAVGESLPNSATWHLDPYGLWAEAQDPEFPDKTFADLDRFADAQARIVEQYALPLFDRCRTLEQAMTPNPLVRPAPTAPIGRSWAMSYLSFSSMNLPPVDLVAAMLRGVDAFEKRLQALGGDGQGRPAEGGEDGSDDDPYRVERLQYLARCADYLRRYLAAPGTLPPPAPIPTALDATAAEIARRLRRPLRPYSTYDFGRARDTATRSIVVDEAAARSEVRRLRGRLPAGLQLFVGTRQWLGDEKHGEKVELVVAAGASPFDILRTARVDPVNHGLTTEDVVRTLQRYDQMYGVEILAACTDAVNFDVLRLPEDLLPLATDLDAFCPDLVEVGLGTVEELARQIRKAEGHIALWWD